MKINDLLNKVVEVVNDRIKIYNVEFSRSLRLEDSRHTLTDHITIFYYDKELNKTNFTTTVYDYMGNYSKEVLLNIIDFKIKEMFCEEKNLEDLEV